MLDLKIEGTRGQSENSKKEANFENNQRRRPLKKGNARRKEEYSCIQILDPEACTFINIRFLINRISLSKINPIFILNVYENMLYEIILSNHVICY